MLMKLDTTWFVFAVAAVAMLAYLFSIGLHAVTEESGFGPVASTGIITSGFFGAIYAANHYGIRFDTLLGATVAGLVGSFIVYFFLVLLKLALNRLA